MAKDAKGHGSEAHGGALTPVQRENLPFKHSISGPHYLDPHDPRGLTPKDVLAMRDSETANRVAAAVLSSGGSKSAAAPVHDSMTHNDQGHVWGSPEAIKDFTTKLQNRMR